MDQLTPVPKDLLTAHERRPAESSVECADRAQRRRRFGVGRASRSRNQSGVALRLPPQSIGSSVVVRFLESLQFQRTCIGTMNRRRPGVAQSCTLPYRRIEFCGASIVGSTPELADTLPTKNRRYGRLKPATGARFMGRAKVVTS
jgi:hypothetical protein